MTAYVLVTASNELETRKLFKKTWLWTARMALARARWSCSKMRLASWASSLLLAALEVDTTVVTSGSRSLRRIALSQVSQPEPDRLRMFMRKSVGF